jgi:Carboxypeptidase regulatory-like domain/TonB-dependent Receptor Plug Domain
MLRSVRVHLSCLCILLVGCSILAVPAWGQSDVGTIVGFVRDHSGAFVPGARVTVQNEGTGQEQTVISDAQGRYTITNLQPADYTMTAEAKGFKKFISTHNRLSASTTINIDAALDIGQLTETVEVTATASVLQTESGAVQSQVTGQQIRDQQLNGRNPLYMGSLLPGLRSGSTLGDFNFAVGGGVPFQINGARTQDTLVTFDGAPAVRTRGSGAIIGVASVDATQEMQVLTAGYQAEYGGAAGGQIRLVSKSGTTDFHGSAYEYLRNSAMNANTWSRNLSPTTRFASPFVYNNFGFTFGGPVWIPGWHATDPLRQKLFFFINEDWIRYRFADTQQQSVPTLRMRQGDFSELLVPGNPWYSGSAKVYDPATCTDPVKGAASCVQFPGNVIPSGRLSANGLAILNAYPAPTPGFLVGNQNWIAQAAHPINQRKEVINVDFILSQNHHIEFRRQGATYLEYQPFDQGSGLTGKYFNRPNQTNGLAWTWTISPSLINELRGTVSIDRVYIPVNTALAGFNRQTLGINFPYIIPGAKAAPNKIPSVTLPGGFYGIQGGPYPSHSQGPIYTITDSVTKVWGNHTVKAGVYFNYQGENDNDQINVSTVPGGANNQNGSFVFTDGRSGLGGTTGVGIANLAVGLADSYTEIGPKSYTKWSGQMYEFFGQDAWKVTSKLHIDYGLRVTILTPYKPAWGNAVFFDPGSFVAANAPQVNPSTGNVILGTGNPYNGMVIPGFSNFPSSAAAHGVVGSGNNSTACDGGPCTGLFAPHLRNGYVDLATTVQPRLGIAYQLDSKTVFRAGAGEFATRMGLLDNIFPGGNPPFQPFVTVAAVPGNLGSMVDNPGLALNSTVAPPLTVTTLVNNLKSPVRWNWNLTVQRELPLSSYVSIAYVGGRGIHNWRVFDINQPQVGAIQANPGKNINYLRPYQGYAAIQQEQSNGDARYNALQIAWNRRFTNNAMFGVSYTWAKSMDDSSNYRDIVPDTYNTSNLWGPSEYDARHALVVNYLYAFPFFSGQRNLQGQLFGNWRLGGSAQFQTGQPCGIGTNNEYAGVGEVGSFGCGSQGQFWVMNGTPSILKNFSGYPGQTAKYFSTTNADGSPIFTQPTAGTFNLQRGVRNSIYGPGFQNWNISLHKDFPVSERARFEFATDAYNFINHSNWAQIGQTGGPDLNPTSGTFGRVTQKSTTNPRQLQVSLKLIF